MPDVKKHSGTCEGGELSELASSNVPIRQCIVTRERHPQANMLRFVRSPDGNAVCDLKGNLPGRGAWVRLSEPVLREAVKRKAFRRAIDADAEEMLIEQVRRQLEQKVLAGLGMARRSGELICGFDSVERALKSKGGLAMLFSASDATDNGIEKLERLVGTLPWERRFDREALSRALGQNNLVHIGIKSVIVCRSLQQGLFRLRRFEGTMDEIQSLKADDENGKDE